MALAYTYAVPGIYIARLRITNAASQTFTSFRRVLVQDQSTTRQTLCAVYGHVRSSLAASDAPAASQAFAEDSRARYLAFFQAMGTNMPIAATRLGTIADGLVNTDFAQLKVIKDNGGQPKVFPLEFVRNDKGVWLMSNL